MNAEEYERERKIIASEEIRDYIIEAIDKVESARIIAIEEKKPLVVYKLKSSIKSLYIAMDENFSNCGEINVTNEINNKLDEKEIKCFIDQLENSLNKFAKEIKGDK